MTHRLGKSGRILSQREYRPKNQQHLTDGNRLAGNLFNETIRSGGWVNRLEGGWQNIHPESLLTQLSSTPKSYWILTGCVCDKAERQKAIANRIENGKTMKSFFGMWPMAVALCGFILSRLIRQNKSRWTTIAMRLWAM